jgi:hypothetical protein
LDAGWTVVLPTVAALVTDSGGVLSHSAIMAREFGVPTVVASGNASTVLTDGQLVEVDGASTVTRPSPGSAATTKRSCVPLLRTTTSGRSFGHPFTDESGPYCREMTCSTTTPHVTGCGT